MESAHRPSCVRNIAATRSIGDGDAAVVRWNASQPSRDRTSANASITVEANAESACKRRDCAAVVDPKSYLDRCRS